MTALAHKPPVQSLQSILRAMCYQMLSDTSFKAISSIYGRDFRVEIVLKGLVHQNKNGEIVQCH